jgi:hypothetical protein
MSEFVARPCGVISTRQGQGLEVERMLLWEVSVLCLLMSRLVSE